MNETTILILIISAYFIPSIIAGSKRKQNAFAIFVVNILLGWTLVGWMVSFVWALTNDDKKEQPVTVVKKKVSVSSELERLASLKEKGILTEEEFQKQKEKVLEK